MTSGGGLIAILIYTSLKEDRARRTEVLKGVWYREDLDGLATGGHDAELVPKCHPSSSSRLSWDPHWPNLLKLSCGVCGVPTYEVAVLVLKKLYGCHPKEKGFFVRYRNGNVVLNDEQGDVFRIRDAVVCIRCGECGSEREVMIVCKLPLNMPPINERRAAKSIRFDGTRAIVKQ